MTNVKPRCASWSDELETLVQTRCRDEDMTRSEYLRKCIREEAERAHANRVQRMLLSLPFSLTTQKVAA